MIYVTVRHPWTTFVVVPGEPRLDKVSGRELPDPPIGRKLAEFANGICNTTDSEVMSYLDLLELDGVYRHDNRLASILLQTDAAGLNLANREAVSAQSQAQVISLLEMARQLEAGIGGATLQILPGLRHLTFVERPDIVADVLSNLMSRVAGPVRTLGGGSS